jgi:predicted site-specific integrase-resolvase
LAKTKKRNGRPCRELLTLTTEDIADIFGVERRTVFRWIESGLLLRESTTAAQRAMQFKKMVELAGKKKVVGG